MSSFNFWLYFLDEWEADAELVQNIGAPPGQRASHGSGRMREYERMPADFWEVREAFMRSAPVPPPAGLLVPKGPVRRIAMPDRSPPRYPAPPPPRRIFTDDERSTHLSAMKGAASLDSLKAISKTLRRYT